MGAISETFLAVGHNGCYPNDWSPARALAHPIAGGVPCTSGEDGGNPRFPHQAHAALRAMGGGYCF